MSPWTSLRDRLRFRPRRRAPLPIWARPTGERALASAETNDGRWLVGTPVALWVMSPQDSQRWPWEEIQSSQWDDDEQQLVVRLVGVFNQPRPVSSYRLTDPGMLAQLLRERITASVVLQRHHPVHGKKGFRVIGRRSPVGGEITWMCDLEPGVDPDDPAVQKAMQAALTSARSEVGQSPA